MAAEKEEKETKPSETLLKILIRVNGVMVVSTISSSEKKTVQILKMGSDSRFDLYFFCCCFFVCSYINLYNCADFIYIKGQRAIFTESFIELSETVKA